MVKRTSAVWSLIQQYMDSQHVRVNQSAVADALGVERSALSQWKYRQALPKPENLRRLHGLTRIPYRQFLDALLVDMGYLDAEELMGNAKHPAPIGLVTQSAESAGSDTVEDVSEARFEDVSETVPADEEASPLPDGE